MQEAQEKLELHQKLLKYPPFYTLQDHKQTRQSQVTRWSEIVHLYFQSHKIIESSVSETLRAPIFQDNSSGLIKRLDPSEIKEILEQMAKLGSIEFRNDENFQVNLVSPFELADAIYAWAKEKKLIGYTETLSGISEGSLTDQSKKFHELPKDQILKACNILEETGRAQVYEFDGQYSVKFI